MTDEEKFHAEISPSKIVAPEAEAKIADHRTNIDQNEPSPWGYRLVNMRYQIGDGGNRG